eukprot:TRINITY_DN55530_c0_g1_i2.p1 TRINITY_DN55530_c0_g1~~TRINITY_DN55530_c0_g1_i2.p1  ORF type:complete len:204 (-),score=35.34 TRINITY_DN55530_c0_g1_i2:110-721(-)
MRRAVAAAASAAWFARGRSHLEPEDPKYTGILFSLPQYKCYPDERGHPVCTTFRRVFRELASGAVEEIPVDSQGNVIRQRAPRYQRNIAAGPTSGTEETETDGKGESSEGEGASEEEDGSHPQRGEERSMEAPMVVSVPGTHGRTAAGGADQGNKLDYTTVAEYLRVADEHLEAAEQLHAAAEPGPTKMTATEESISQTAPSE